MQPVIGTMSISLDGVGAGQQFSGRLAAQDERAARSRVDPVCRIGLAALELAYA